MNNSTTDAIFRVIHKKQETRLFAFLKSLVVKFAGFAKTRPALLIPLLLLFATAMQAGVITVSNTDDSGAGSLRQAIIDLNADGGGTVLFSNAMEGAVIELASSLPDITAPIDIEGKSITVSGNNTFMLLRINSSATVNISRIHFTGGKAGSGGAIYNNAYPVRLESCIFSNNSATNGGAIYNNGRLDVRGCTFYNNSANRGGAIYNAWTKLTIIQGCILFNNADNSAGCSIYNDTGSVQSYGYNAWNNNDNDFIFYSSDKKITEIPIDINDGFRPIVEKLSLIDIIPSSGITGFPTTDYYGVTRTTVAGAVTYSIPGYTVTFDSRGGSEVEAIRNITSGATITAPVAPTRTGHTFDGWFEDAACTVPRNFSVPITAGITLYAGWTAHTYTVIYNKNGGIGDMANSIHTYGSATPLTANSYTRSGYKFAGWALTAIGNKVYDDRHSPSTLTAEDGGNINLYAKWTLIVYTVAFDSRGGSEVEAIENVTPGATVTAPVPPTRTGYIFNNWYREASCTDVWNFTLNTVIRDTVLYAGWTAQTYTVTYNLNGGDNINAGSYTVESAELSLPVPTRTGYTFAGWYDNEEQTGTAVEKIAAGSVGNKTFWAKWKNADANAVSLNISAGTLTPAFNAAITEYTLDVLNEIDKITVTATANADASVTGNVSDKPLVVGNNVVKITVTAEDGTVKEYTITVIRAVSTDATLSGLTVSAGILNPAFNANTTEYTVDVPNEITEITVTGTKNNAAATVSGNDTYELNVGENEIEIMAVAEDGTTFKVYKVTVIRAKSNAAELIALQVNGKSVYLSSLLYRMICGETMASFEMEVSPGASIKINGNPYSRGTAVQIPEDVTVISIGVTSESGTATNVYDLTVLNVLDGHKLLHQRWSDVLAINHNLANNGGYTVSAICWYRKGQVESFSNDKYIELESSNEYYVEVEINGNWHRVCGGPVIRSMEKVYAYPNPVSRGESLTLNLSEKFVGGTLNIYTLSGRPEKTGLPLHGEQTAINVSDLSPGVYLFTVSTKTGEKQDIKVIVE